MVPNLVSYDDPSNPFQFFSPLTSKQRSPLEEMCSHGVSSEKFDEIVANLSDHPKSVLLLSTDKMKIPESNYDQFNDFHQVFAGGGSPVVDNNLVTLKIPNENMSVHWCFCSSMRFNYYVPLSTGCFDTMVHYIKVIQEFIYVINKAVGKNGLFTGRSRAKHQGSCLYLGVRAKKSQNIPSPSKGPCEHDCWYYWQYINNIYWTFVLKLYNRLGCEASHLDWYVYKHLAVLYPWNITSSSKIRYF